MPKYEKVQENVPKDEKVCESLPKAEKVCQMLLLLLVAIFAVQILFFCAQYISLLPFLGG